MTNVKWLLDSQDLGEDLSLLTEEIKKQGMDYKVVKCNPFLEDIYCEYNDKDCVVSYGTINFINQIKHKPWTPNIWLTEDQFRCTKYYSYYGKYLINQDYTFIPYSEFVRRRHYWQPVLSDMEIFIRPDSNMKTFNGMALNSMYKLEDYCYDKIDPDTLVIVAPYKKILYEWRFIVVDRQVITGSQYKKNGRKDINPYCPEGAAFMAQEIANEEWMPDSVFVIDIGMTCDHIGLIEIGSFNCAGLYECDRSKIVEYVSKVAIKEHSDYYRSI